MVAGNRENERIKNALDEALKILQPLAEVVFVDLGLIRTLETKGIDIVFVFGGDGSILRVAQMLRGALIPVVGVNVGRFGFLTEFEMDEFRVKVEEWIKKVPEPSARVMFAVTLTSRRKKGYVLNEMAVIRSGATRIAHLEFLLNGEFITEFAGDGVLVATPTGSTAYSLSAGGPVVPPDTPVMVVTPINPHTLTNRPLVLPDDSVVTVKVADGRVRMVLAMDGQTSIPLRQNDEVKIEKSERRFLLVENGLFFETLKKKLSWGGVPNYGKGKNRD